MGAQTSRVPLPSHSIPWHRTKLTTELSKTLHETSNFKGLIQAGGVLTMLLGSAFLAVHFSASSQTSLAIFFSLAYGLQANFLINGMHELGHGFVFKSKFANGFFLRVVSFLGWLHPDMFFSSHLRHHRYTQNPPHDLENPMPIRIRMTDFLKFGFVNITGARDAITQTVCAAMGWYPTGHLGWLPEWEAVCYPPSLPAARAPAQYWAVAMILGHTTLAILSLTNGYFLLPFLISFGPFYNGWLFFLCNSTQHVGLQPNASDFRVNCRTFYLTPLVRFIYWHMNWHIEHHMYAAVPCYHLEALHHAIKHDLPPTPNGLVEVWEVISDTLRKQERDPTYVQVIRVP